MQKRMVDNALNQMPLALSGQDLESFENFVVADDDENNQLICKALQDFAAQGSTQQAIPFFLAGASGTGKTHLLCALVSALQNTNSRAGVYLDLELVPQNTGMLEMALSAPFVCIDNIDAWAGQPELEQALFAVVEAAKNDRRLLVVTAKAQPNNCDFALRDLVSRLGSGVVFVLQAIDDETKAEAVKLRAKNRGLIISDDAIAYLLNHHARDSRSLFSSLKELDRASIISKRKVTIPFIQEVLAGNKAQ